MTDAQSSTSDVSLAVIEEAVNGSLDPHRPNLELLAETDEAGRPTQRAWREIGKAFRLPMKTKSYTGRGNKKFDFVTARQVQDRLDRVVGPGNWSSEVSIVNKDHPVSVLVGIGVFGVWKWDVGYPNTPEAPDEFTEVRDREGKPVVDQATGEVKMRRVEDEPLKAAVSDGFKRAAVQHGIGRFLYGET